MTEPGHKWRSGKEQEKRMGAGGASGPRDSGANQEREPRDYVAETAGLGRDQKLPHGLGKFKVGAG